MKYDATKGGYILLGRCGENLARTVEIDVSEYLAEYPGAVVTLLHRRHGESGIYPVAAELRDGCLVWQPTSGDTAIVGDGEAEVRVTVDGVLAKSKILSTVVDKSLTGQETDAPEPGMDWVDKITTAIGSVQNMKAEAESVAYGEPATAEYDGKTGTMHFGIPEGKPGRDGTDGKDGADAPQIDDDAVTAENPWSSKQIVDTLCQDFSVSGNPVSCSPVKHYPLGITVSWEPKQGGTGEPCALGGGKNLFNVNGDLLKSGGDFTIANDAITFTGFSTSNYFPFAGWLDVEPNTEYIASFEATSIGAIYVYTDRLLGTLVANSDASNNYRFNSGGNSRVLIGFYSLASKRSGSEETVTNIQVEKGTTATEYVPYANIRPISGRNSVNVNINGVSHTYSLPSTIYGGNFDASTGTITQKYSHVTLDKAIFVNLAPNANKEFASVCWIWENLGGQNSQTYISNAFVVEKWDSVVGGNIKVPRVLMWYANSSFGIAFNKAYFNISDGMSDSEFLNFATEFLDSLPSPLQIAYRLSVPVTHQITELDKISGVGGVNNISTDADTLTVTGKEVVKSYVKDVSVSGKSVLTDGIANVPKAEVGKLGVTSCYDPWVGGLYLSTDGFMRIVAAPSTDIDSRATAPRPIVSSNLDYAVKAAMCDGKGAAWTAGEQAAAKERLGVDRTYELIEEITLAEDSSRVERTMAPDGTPYSFSAMKVQILSMPTEKTGINALMYMGDSADPTYIYFYIAITNANAGCASTEYGEAALRNGYWMATMKKIPGQVVLTLMGLGLVLWPLQIHLHVSL